jgi:hypothetical protein
MIPTLRLYIPVFAFAKITYRYLPTFESLINLSFNHKYFSSTQSTSLLPQKALQIFDNIELFMGPDVKFYAFLCKIANY